MLVIFQSHQIPVQHLAEHIIERFLRDDTLKASKRRAVKAHLSECTECRQIFDWLHAFYEKLDELEIEKKDWIHLEEKQKTTHKLIPFEPESDVAGPFHSTMVLAAQSERPQHRFDHIATLYSRNQDILVRILYDHEKECYELYLIMNNAGQQGLVLVTLPYYQKNLVTNEKGRVNFRLQRNRETDRWKDVQGILRSPLSYCRLHKGDIDAVKPVKGITKQEGDYTFFLRSTSSNQKIEIEVRDERLSPNNLSKLLVKDSQGESSIFELNNNRIQLGRAKLKEKVPFTLAVYE